jgi:hypothetical protein
MSIDFFQRVKSEDFKIIAVGCTIKIKLISNIGTFKNVLMEKPFLEKVSFEIKTEE